MGFLFITANDIHISDINPRSRKDDFKLAILSKIEQMGRACRKFKADAAIIAGDLFNIKSPTRNSHRLNKELISLFKTFHCPIYMIPGNHDLTANNLQSINDQPLGVLFESGVLKNLSMESMTKNGKKVNIMGIPYEENLDISSIQSMKDNDSVKICVLHLCASPNGGMLFKEKVYSYEELSAIGADIYVIGHLHKDQGVQKIGEKYFINIGSISRGSLTDENIDHQPQIGVVRISDEGKIDISTIKLKTKPASEVFDLTRREEEQKQSTAIEEFVEKLTEEKVMEESGGSIMGEIKNMDIAKEIRDKVLFFIQEATR